MRSTRGFACLRPSLRFSDAGWSPAREPRETRPTALPDPSGVAADAGARLAADPQRSAPAAATPDPATWAERWDRALERLSEYAASLEREVR